MIFFGFLVLFFKDTWLTVYTYFARDVVYFVHPRFVFSAENIQAGHLPFWNPYSAGGVPWLGDPQASFFSPGSLLFFLFPFAIAFKLLSVFHFFVTGLGGYLLARLMKGSRMLSLLSSVLWCINGFWLGRLEFVGTMGTLMWLPFMLLFLVCFYYKSKKKGDIAPVAFVLGLIFSFAFMSGYLPFLLWFSFLMLLFSAVSIRRVFLFKWLVVSSLVAAGLCSLQLFPTLETILLSHRFQKGLSYSSSTLYSLEIFDLLGIISPWVGTVKESAFLGEKFPSYNCFFLGIGGFVLSLLSFVCLKRKWKWFVGGLFVVGAFLALGKNNPLYGFLYHHVPVFQWVRYPGQYALFMIVSCLLAFVFSVKVLSQKITFKWQMILFCFVFTELFVYGYKMYPTLPNSFFRQQPEWIDAVQVNREKGRFFLSPAASSLMKGQGRSVADAWVDLRHRLYNIVSLPFHIYQLNPVGTTFIPNYSARRLYALYQTPDFESALEGLGFFNVVWVAAPRQIEKESLLMKKDYPWFVYKIKNHSPPGYVNFSYGDAESVLPWERHQRNPDHQVWTGENSGQGVLHVSEIYYPGWRAFGNGHVLDVERDKGIFCSVKLPENCREIHFLYRPVWFFMGLFVSLMAVIFLCLMGGLTFFSLKHRV